MDGHVLVSVAGFMSPFFDAMEERLIFTNIFCLKETADPFFQRPPTFRNLANLVRSALRFFRFSDCIWHFSVVDYLGDDSASLSGIYISPEPDSEE
jgi:hypothetical protein